ncbi:MAG: hypothetical protein Ct9H300mP16_17420 [Pseudomonadota bacterium]|nr:MAG: hypothetical protein Ct9H300mP16_17420 [Pseudomonadota bacterium]
MGTPAPAAMPLIATMTGLGMVRNTPRAACSSSAIGRIFFRLAFEGAELLEITTEAEYAALGRENAGANTLVIPGCRHGGHQVGSQLCGQGVSCLGPI